MLTSLIKTNVLPLRQITWSPVRYKDRWPFAGIPFWYVTSRLGQLSLLPSVRRETSTGQCAAMLCGWEVKTVIAHAWQVKLWRHPWNALENTVETLTRPARVLLVISNLTYRNVGNVRNVRNLLNVGRWRNGHTLRTLRENMETKLHQWFLLVNSYGFYVKNRNRFYSYRFHVYVTFFAVHVKTYTWKFSRIRDFIRYLRYLPTLREGGNHELGRLAVRAFRLGLCNVCSGRVIKLL